MRSRSGGDLHGFFSPEPGVEPGGDWSGGGGGGASSSSSSEADSSLSIASMPKMAAKRASSPLRRRLASRLRARFSAARRRIFFALAAADLCGNQPLVWGVPTKLQNSLSRSHRSRFG